MKTFQFRKTEHHSLSKFYDASLDEDEIWKILNEYDSERSTDLMIALMDPNHKDHDEAMNIVTQSEVIEDRWDWADEDDLWTDRKGGYDVTYSYEGWDEASEENTDNLTMFDDSSDWPFENASPPTDDNPNLTESKANVASWPFPAAKPHEFSVNDSDPDEEKIDLPVCTEEGTYKIEIFSRGMEVGIGNISKEQYEFWEAKDEDVLADALNENIDYDDIECPEEARFSGYYSDYYDDGVCGADGNSSHIEITSPSGVKIYEGDIVRLYRGINQLLGEDKSCTSQGKFVWVDDLDPGYYVVWQMGGKGCYFETNIELKAFDFSKLSFVFDDFEGMDLISAVEYDGEDLENWGGSWDGKWSSYAVHHIPNDSED